MYDIALDSQGDIAIVNGDLVLTNSISQAVLIAMRWAKGEWKYNTELGVDYFGSILSKSPDLNSITRIIREEILAVDGVQEIEKCDLSLDPKTRKLTVNVRAKCESETVNQEVVLNVR